MSFPIESYGLPTEYQFAPVDHAPGMCISDSLVHHQTAKAPPEYIEDFSLRCLFEEEANTLEPEQTFPVSEQITTDEAREYLQNRFVTYRMTLEIADSASTEVEESPLYEHHSPLSSPQSVISTAKPAKMTDEEKTDAALETYIRQSSNPLTSWL